MSMRLGLGLGLPYFVRAGVAAYQQILDLAAADGWTAVYDPSNPGTRTLRTDGSDQYVTAIADGLGNRPDLVQATEANQFKFLPRQFGRLDGLEGNGTSTFMVSSSFTSHAQPNFDLILAANDAIDGTVRVVFDGSSGTNENFLFQRDTVNEISVSAGTGLHTGDFWDSNPHILGTLWNGASSVVYMDSAELVTGDAGANPREVFRLGCRRNSSGFWSGKIGVWLHYDGDPGAAKRTRMFDLYHDLTGIAKA